LTKVVGTRASIIDDTHEGFAEFVRRYIMAPDSFNELIEVDPEAKEALPGYVDPKKMLKMFNEIYEHFKKYMPGLMNSLGNAQNMWEAHMERSPMARQQAESSDTSIKLSESGWDRLNHFLNTLGPGAWVAGQRIYHELERNIISHYKRQGYSAKKSREIAKNTINVIRYGEKGKYDIRTKAVMVTNLSQFRSELIAGTPTKNGLYVINDKGQKQYFTDKSIKDIFKPLKNNKEYKLFHQWVTNKAWLCRYDVILKETGIEIDFPGRGSGVKVKDIRKNVEEGEKKHTWVQAAKDINEFYDAILDIKKDMGLYSEEEVQRIKNKYSFYTNLRHLFPDDSKYMGGKLDYPMVRKQGAGSTAPYVDTIDAMVNEATATLSSYYRLSYLRGVLNLSESLKEKRLFNLPKDADDLASWSYFSPDGLAFKATGKNKSLSFILIPTSNKTKPWDVETYKLGTDGKRKLINKTSYKTKLDAVKALHADAENKPEYSTRLQKELLGDKALPMGEVGFEAERLLGFAITRIPQQSRIVANLSPEEVLNHFRRVFSEFIDEEIDLEEMIQEMPEEGITVWRTKAPRGLGIIRIPDNKEPGKFQYYRINDPLLLDWFAPKQIQSENIKNMVDMFAKMRHPWQKAITSVLRFSLFNFWRDVVQSGFNADGSIIPGANFLAGVGNIIVVSANNLLGENTKDLSFLEKEIQKILKIPGIKTFVKKHPGIPNATNIAKKLRAVSTYQQKTPDIFQTKHMARILEGIYIQGYWKMPWEKKLFEALPFLMNLMLKPVNLFLDYSTERGLSEFVEQSTRTGAAYWEAKRMEKRGIPPRHDILKQTHADSTTNYQDQIISPVGAAITRMVAFGNPAIQSFWNHFSRLSDPAKWPEYLARLGFYGVIIPLIMWAINQLLSDEEDDKRRRRQSDIERTLYMDLKGVRLPFGFGPVGAVQSITYNAMDAYVKDLTIMDKQRFAYNLLVKSVEAPVIPGQGSLFPFGLDIAYELRMNRSMFYGSYIESPFLELSDEKADRSYFDTPSFYKDAAKWSKNVKEEGLFSPIKFQYFVRQGLNKRYDEAATLWDLYKMGLLNPEYLKEQPTLIPIIGEGLTKHKVGYASKPYKDINHINPKRQLEKIKENLPEELERLAKLYGENNLEQSAESIVLKRTIAFNQRLEEALKLSRKIELKAKEYAELDPPDLRTVHKLRTRITEECEKAQKEADSILHGEKDDIILKRIKLGSILKRIRQNKKNP
jgi:hypothetical protein